MYRYTSTDSVHLERYSRILTTIRSLWLAWRELNKVDEYRGCFWVVQLDSYQLPTKIFDTTLDINEDIRFAVFYKKRNRREHKTEELQRWYVLVNLTRISA